MRYDDLKKAINILGVLPLSSRSDIKKRYLELSKRYHPDCGGDKEEFENINKAYDIIKNYIDNFKYSFEKDEFNRQNPLLGGRDIVWGN